MNAAKTDLIPSSKKYVVMQQTTLCNRKSLVPAVVFWNFKFTPNYISNEDHTTTCRGKKENFSYHQLQRNQFVGGHLQTGMLWPCSQHGHRLTLIPNLRTTSLGSWSAQDAARQHLLAHWRHHRHHLSPLPQRPRLPQGARVRHFPPATVRLARPGLSHFLHPRLWDAWNSLLHQRGIVQTVPATCIRETIRKASKFHSVHKRVSVHCHITFNAKSSLVSFPEKKNSTQKLLTLCNPRKSHKQRRDANVTLTLSTD